MGISGKTVLLIDDSEEHRILSRKILEAAGLKICEAITVKRAVDMINKEAPHLIFLDMKLMGKETGYDFLKIRNQESRMKNIPVICLSAYSKTKLINKALSFGATDYIVKPVSASKLLQKVRKHLRGEETQPIQFKEGERPQIKVKVDAFLTQINEVSVVVRSSVKLTNKSIIDVRAEFLESIGAGELPLEIKKLGQFQDTGFFDTQMVMLGVTERIAREIRRMGRNQ